MGNSFDSGIALSGRSRKCQRQVRPHTARKYTATPGISHQKLAWLIWFQTSERDRPCKPMYRNTILTSTLTARTSKRLIVVRNSNREFVFSADKEAAGFYRIPSRVPIEHSLYTLRLSMAQSAFATQSRGNKKAD